MELKSDESLVYQEGASHFKDFIAVGGELTLTSRRLVFKSTSRLSDETEVEIDVSRITQVEFFKTLNISPNGLMLMLSDGSIENFIVDDRQFWRRQILSCVKAEA